MIVKTVLISGKQGSGKSSLATALRERMNSHSRYICQDLAFAEPLYEMQDKVKEVCVFYDLEPFQKDGGLLQYLGTDFGRKRYGIDVWCNIAKKRIERFLPAAALGGAQYVVPIISDCRFKNEVEAFKNDLKIRLECPEWLRKERILATPGQNWRENNTHQSEIDLDDFTGWDEVYDTQLWTTKKIVDDLEEILLRG